MLTHSTLTSASGTHPRLLWSTCSLFVVGSEVAIPCGSRPAVPGFSTLWLCARLRLMSTKGLAHHQRSCTHGGCATSRCFNVVATSGAVPYSMAMRQRSRCSAQWFVCACSCRWHSAGSESEDLGGLSQPGGWSVGDGPLQCQPVWWKFRDWVAVGRQRLLPRRLHMPWVEASRSHESIATRH